MTRVLSGVALAAAALAAILLLPIDGLRIVVCGLTLVAAHEYARLAEVRGSAGRLLLMLAATAVCWWVSTAIPTPVVLGLTAALMWVAVHVLVLGRAVPFVLGLVAPAYLGMPLGMLVAVHARGGWRATSLLIATVVVSDTAQYYSGRAFGRRLLAPAISPKKTIEGALGGALLGTVFMMAAGRSVVPGAPLGALALLGAGLVVLGICGDLFESRLKRAAGVKDSSALIPGHGGVLDRIDALLFATPAFYLFLANV
jgi:phosphatidate cytidylyltransferase